MWRVTTVWVGVMVILLHQLMNQIEGNRHEYGPQPTKGYDVILNRRVFERNASLPTNYTVFYKFMRSKLGGEIVYVGINVENCESKGAIKFEERMNTTNIVEATINVTNCLNLNITAIIFGYHATIASQLSTDPEIAEIYGEDIFQSKSFALIYAHNETRSKKHYISIGQRQTNDTLLNSEEKTVTKDYNSFPEHEILYNDTTAFITHVQFIFNSPTATVFLNSSYIQPQSFNAIVYDLNRPQFTMNVNVFGYHANDKPSQYKSIIT